MARWTGRSVGLALTAIVVGILPTGCHDAHRAEADHDVADTPPNFVVFVADDMGWNDIGYHGSEVSTPHLDTLAETGLRLDQFYVYPSCSPTRAALLTGRNPSRFNILGPISGTSKDALPEGTVTLPGRLGELGYVTGITGKWHLGLRPEVGPRKYGFSYSYGYLHGQICPYTHLYKTGARTWHRNDMFIDEDGHVTDLLTDDAIRFIRRNRGRPFFLYVPFSVPHYPLAEPARYTQPYELMIENESRRLFAASETHMDEGIGKVLSTLDRLGLRENTMVVFMSDNGGQESWSSRTEYNGRYRPHDQLGSNKPLRGWKGSVYEGGVRVPALVQWPGRIRPGVVEGVTAAMDLMPTILRLAGAEESSGDTDAPVEGRDLTSVFLQGASPGDRVLYWKTGGQSAVRRGDWKLIQRRGEKPVNELYNIAEDPCETTDLASREPQRVAELLEVLRDQKSRDPS